MNEGDSEDKKLKWRFDISTFRLIGRELITDRITALFELVKNCYDANATRVDVVFENVSYDNAVVDDTTKEVRVNPGSKIVIEDNGYGMSFEDIRDKWMVIGAVMDFLDRHLPEKFRPLVERARELLPVPEVQQPEQEQERGHTWGGMEL